MDGERHIIVVGGGLTGILAAAYAVRGGAKVTLFERASEAGGRARTEVEQGFSLNLGPHAIYPGDSTEKALAGLGVALQGGYPGGTRKAYFGGRLWVMPTGAATTLRSGLLGVRGKAQLAQAMGVFRHEPSPDLDTVPLRSWLEANFRDSRARQYFEALTRVATYMNDSETLPASVALARLRDGRKGVIYQDGGWQRLVDQACAAAGEGLTIRRGARVEGITERADGVEARLADGTTVAATAAILAVSPADVAGMLPGSVAAARYAEKATPVRAACLDLCMRKLPRPDFQFAVGVDRPVYLSVHSVAAKLAPEGHHLVSLAWYLRPGEHGTVDHEGELEMLMDRMQPGWREHVILRRWLPSLIVAQDSPRAADGGYRGRPGVQVPGSERLFLAGDWVGDHGMLADAGAHSAMAAAALAGKVRQPELVGATV